MAEETELLRQRLINGCHRRTPAGASLLPACRAVAAYGWGLSLTMLGIFAVLVFARFTEVESGRGILETRPGPRQVVAPVAALIEEILVKPGELVSEGQLLARLSSDRFDALGVTRTELRLEHLQDKRQGLRRELQLGIQSRRLQEQQIDRAEVFENQQYDHNEEELALLSEQLALAESAFLGLQKLAGSANLAQTDVDRQQAAVLTFKRQQQQLRSTRLRITERLAELAMDREKLQLQGRQQALLMRQRLKSLEQEIIQAGYASRDNLVASVAGRVTSIALQAGQYSNPGQPLFVIRPARAQLVGQAYVPARIASRLNVQQAVMLRFDAYDYRRHGRYPARVGRVDEEALDPRRYLLPVPGLQVPVVRVEVELSPDSFAGLPRPLAAGDSFTADFVFDERSLFSYLLRPLLKLRGRIT